MPVPEGIHLYSWVDENDDEQHQVTKVVRGFPQIQESRVRLGVISTTQMEKP